MTSPQIINDVKVGSEMNNQVKSNGTPTRFVTKNCNSVAIDYVLLYAAFPSIQLRLL